MSSLITEFPPITVAIERALREGMFKEKVTERQRMIAAAKVNKTQSEAVLDPNGMGLRRALTVDAQNFWRINEKYGNEAWGDDDFLASFRKYAPGLTTKHTPYKKRVKAQETIIYTGRS